MSEVIKLNPAIVELTEQDYQTWKRHPVGAAFFKWMEDKLGDYRTGAADHLEYGPVDRETLLEFKHRITFCRELGDLHLSDIKAFYQQRDNVG